MVATLIHRQDTDVVPDPDPAGPMPALYLHGWSDYVFQVHVLEHLADRGFDVWAMDLRKHGRSLREGQTPTAIAYLEDYDSEVDAALAAMGGRAPLVIAHSTGGLVAALYAARHPGRFSGLVLNSPWLAFHGHPSLGKALERPVHAIASRRPFVQVMPRGADHYARTIHSDYGGDFTYDLELKPIGGHPFPAATFGAVLAGQAALTVADPISEPVLVLRAARSYFGRLLSERMSRSDVVLDVRAIARAALRLGEDVEDAPIEDARHDVFLSDPAVIDEV
ncbi:MAG: alpha/beta hydrolase, partial [Brachybacterium sp.]|nr:alpha/beta hydrolase [Brachybacterium sp.]